MARNKAKTASRSKTGKLVINTATQKGAASSMVRFGSAVISADAPTRRDLQRNVTSGQRALARAATKIVKAGVSLRDVSSVPLYHADPKEAGRLIRELNGKRSKGYFVGGKFRVLSKA